MKKKPATAKRPENKYTVFLHPPNHDLGDWPWWTQVRATGWKQAAKRAIKLHQSDCVKAGLMAPGSLPDAEEYTVVVVIKGWNDFRLEV